MRAALCLLSGFVALADASGGVPLADGQDYNEDRARNLAHYAGAAYCSQDLIASWSCDHCQQATNSMQADVIYNSQYDMQAYVGMNGDNQVVVSFRGSQSLTNWIENLWTFAEAKYPHCDGCSVHAGFYDTWHSVEEGVLAKVTELIQGKSPQPEVYVVGHSLGGALAVLGAASLHYQHGVEIEAVYTYGQPRVGNEAFRQWYNQGPHVSWRATHYKDPVPHLPLESMGFTHISTEVYYSEDNTQYRICDASGKDSQCSDQWSDGIDLVRNHVDNHHHYIGLNIDSCGPAGVAV
jgi:predicted lipase